MGLIINKSIDDGISINTEKVIISGQRTVEVSDEQIEAMGKTFFPSLIQKLIPKKYEVRVFFFKGIFYSIAIFSQRNDASKIDGRIMSVESEKCCGLFRPDYFTSHTETYTESLTHNTCLNRKISIDAEGNIRNCPSMKESFGNIRDTTLEEDMNKPGFKKYWNITKDQIVKCKDCEFRHICTDCRAYIENPQDPYSAPLKCGYDPYTCQWKSGASVP